MKALLLSGLLLALVGCDTTPKQPSIPETANKTVNFDRRLLEDCPDLPKAKSARDKDIKENGQKIIALYKECRDLKAAENREIKKALNIKD